jgi:hypothetical protein
MSTPRNVAPVSRRAALSTFGASGLGLALVAHSQTALAQSATPVSYAGHPNVGVWMIDSPIGRAIAVYSDDGSVVTALPATQAGPQGVTFSSTQVGTWEPTDERSTHLTVVQLLSDEAGAFVGTVTVDAYQMVSADGQSFTSGAGSSVTIRDAANTVIDVMTSFPPATGVRMGVGSPALPGGTPVTGTPTG